MSSSILFPTNQYTTSSKSSQQIQKLMIPHDIAQSDVISYMLNRNHPLQMPFVYINFHKHFQGLISTICQKAVNQQPQNQILICQSLKVILQKQKYFSLNDLELIFQMTLQCLNNLNSVANEPLTQILELLLKVHPNRQSLLNKLQTQILQLGKPTQSTVSKVTSGRLICIISKHIGKVMIKGQMIDILKKILTDSQIQARKVWVGQIFPKLLQRLQLDFVELHLQEKIYECVYDENEEIGVMALKVILKNTTRFSVEQQSSRIVKLFIDSLTSKNQKVSLMVTSLMGQVYQKLVNVIMRNQTICARFWRSLIELAQCKNQKTLNNLIYNLPGILLLSSKFHRTDPCVEIYCELFYEPLADKVTLISFFHEIGYLYPQKKQQLKQVIYWIFGQLFDQQQEDYHIQAVKIINTFIRNIYKCRSIFFVENSRQLKQNKKLYTNYDVRRGYNNPVSFQKSLSMSYTKLYNKQVDVLVVNNFVSQQPNNVFQGQLCEYLFKYLQLLQQHKNSQWLRLFFNSMKQVSQQLPSQFIQRWLLPKIYNSVSTKSGPIQVMMQLTVILVRRDMSSLMNFYASKIHVQFSKSVNSHERQASLQFLYYSSLYLSIEAFQQYKLGQKFLCFSADKELANRLLFLKYLQRVQYFLTREEKVEMATITSRMANDDQIQVVYAVGEMEYSENEQMRHHIQCESKLFKENQRRQMDYTHLNQPRNSLKPLINNRRSSKQPKKEEIIRKSIQTTKSKSKMLIKQVPKIRAINFRSTLTLKASKTQTYFKSNC